jgi:hypothetical protein
MFDVTSLGPDAEYAYPCEGNAETLFADAKKIEKTAKKEKM